jgi:hypothetical protein
VAKYLALGPSDEFYKALHDKGVLKNDPDEVARVIIDLRAGHPAQIYVQLFPDNQELDAGLVDALLVTPATTNDGGDT